MTNPCSLPLVFCVAIVVFCWMSLCVDAGCYVGSIKSNVDGKIPISSFSRLEVEACGPLPTTVPPLTSKAGTTTNASTTEAPTTELATTAEALTTGALTTNATTAPTTKVPTTNTTQATTTTAKTTKQTTTPPPTTTTTPTASPNQEDSTHKQRRAAEPGTTKPPPTKYCATFKYYAHPTLKVNTTWIANFTCMDDCTSASKATVNGTVGKLQCCNKDKCNDLKWFKEREHLQFETVSTCAVGKINCLSNNVKTGQTCASGNSNFCVNSTDANGITTYSCSDLTENEFCFNHLNNQGQGSCSEVLDSNRTICCCTWDNCNYAEPTPAPTSHGISSGVITGLVFMGFFIGLIVGVCLTCYCFRKKKMTESIDFNYTRITADSTEDAEY